MDAAAIIVAAGKLISDPSRMATGALARNKRGDPCPPSRGRSWCPIGAAYAACGANPTKGSGESNALYAAVAGMQFAASRLHGMSLERVTDEIGHSAVLDVMRLAWKRARSSGGADD